MNYLYRLIPIIFVLYGENFRNNPIVLNLILLNLICDKFTKNTYNKRWPLKINKTYNKKVYLKKYTKDLTKNANLENAMELYKEKLKQEKYKKVNPIIFSTLKQNMSNNYKIIENNKIIKEKVIAKVPRLILSIEVPEVFKGILHFSKPIRFIENISNKVMIKEKSIVIDSNNKITVFIEGYLKVCIDCIEVANNKLYRYTIDIPVLLIRHIDKSITTINYKKDFNNLKLEIVSIKQKTKKELIKTDRNNSYDKCILRININYLINIFKDDLITI